jgi:hypothetical protein
MPTIPRRRAAQRERERLQAAGCAPPSCSPSASASSLTSSSPRLSRRSWKAPRPTGSPASCGRWTASPHGDRAPHQGPPSSRAREGRSCGIGSAGQCSGQRVALPSATRPPSTAGARSGGHRFCKRPTAQSPPGLLRRDRAQPDAQRVPQLGAARPAADLDPPVQLEEGLHGRGPVLRSPWWRGPARLPRPGGQRRHRQPDRRPGELRRFLGGEKATLVWDGLPAHPSRALRAWLNGQRSWLVVKPLPAYAPELNPVEGLWSRPTEASTVSAAPAPGLLVLAAHRLVGLVIVANRCRTAARWWRNRRRPGVILRACAISHPSAATGAGSACSWCSACWSRCRSCSQPTTANKAWRANAPCILRATSPNWPGTTGAGGGCRVGCASSNGMGDGGSGVSGRRQNTSRSMASVKSTPRPFRSCARVLAIYRT